MKRWMRLAAIVALLGCLASGCGTREEDAAKSDPARQAKAPADRARESTAARLGLPPLHGARRCPAT